jgi:hypothetical protein
MFYDAVELYEPTKSWVKRCKAALYVNFLANKKQGVCLLLTWHISLWFPCLRDIELITCDWIKETKTKEEEEEEEEEEER